jgi:hypothetical protein
MWTLADATESSAHGFGHESWDRVQLYGAGRGASNEQICQRAGHIRNLETASESERRQHPVQAAICGGED